MGVVVVEEGLPRVVDQMVGVEEVGEVVVGLQRVEVVEVVAAEEAEGLPRVGGILVGDGVVGVDLLKVVEAHPQAMVEEGGEVGVELHKQEEEEAVEVVAVEVVAARLKVVEMHPQTMVEEGGEEEVEAVEEREGLLPKKEEEGKRKVEDGVREGVENQRKEGVEVLEEEKVEEQGVVVEVEEVVEEDRVSAPPTQTALQATLSALSTAFVSVNLTSLEVKTVGGRVEVEEEQVVVVAKQVAVEVVAEEEVVEEVEGVVEVEEKGHAHLTATAPLRTPSALSGVSASVPPTSQVEAIVGEVEGEANTMGNVALMQIVHPLTQPALSGDSASALNISLVILTVTLGPGRWNKLGSGLSFGYVQCTCGKIANTLSSQYGSTPSPILGAPLPQKNSVFTDIFSN